MTKDRYWRILAVTAVAAATYAYGCGSPDTVEDTVEHGGSLISDEGQIAFTRYTRFAPPDFESEVYTINVDGSDEKRLTDSPGLPTVNASSLLLSATVTGSSTSWTPVAHTNDA
jgi:hypothetical protein